MYCYWEVVTVQVFAGPSRLYYLETESRNQKLSIQNVSHCCGC